jgi:hypothetical protein
MNFKNLCVACVLGCTVTVANGSAEEQSVSTSKKNVITQESIVELQGKIFRKIEYDKNIYYLEMIDSTGATDAYRLMCSRGHDEKLPMQIKAGVKLTERSQFIVEGLRQYCVETKSGPREVALDTRVFAGLQVNLKKDLSKKEGFFKNKKLIITPVDGLVFKADW